MKGLFAKYGLRETVPILATNTAFARSLIGTPVTPALAARSLIFANPISNGDILIAANEGGNSQAYVWIDGSAGEMRLYGSGTLAATITASSVALALDMTIASAVGLVVGSTTQVTLSDGGGATNLVPEGQFLGVGTAFAGGALVVGTFNTTNDRTVSPKLALLKGGAATQVATTAVADNEVIGSIIAYGSDGTDFESPVAAIEFVIDDVSGPTTGQMGGSLEFYTTADGGETLTLSFTINNDQNIYVANNNGVVVGHTAQVAVLAATPEMQVLGTAAADSGALLLRSSADTAGPVLYLAKARDAIGTFTTAITTGDTLGSIQAIGADTADLNANANAAAAIFFVSTGTIAADRIPGSISLRVATDAAPSVLTERVLVTGGGQINFTPVTDVTFANATGVIIGHTAQLTGGANALTSELQVLGTAGDDASILITAFVASAVGPELILAKSRAPTIAVGTIAQDSDNAGQITFAIDDGVDLTTNIARINAQVDGTPGSNDGPGRLVFSTTADGGADSTERLRIASTGLITIAAGTTPASVDTTPGTAHAGSITATGGLGGNTTIATTGVGGIGGGYSLTAGAGGTANSATTAATGGAGGAFTVTTGAGAATAVAGVTATGGASGVITLLSGDGGAVSLAVSGTATGGAAGLVTVQGGVGGAVTATTGTNVGGAGGGVSVIAGAGGAASGATDTGGAGGTVTITAGAGGNGDTSGAAGNVAINAGAAGTGGNINGGGVKITVGAAVGTGAVGAVIASGTVLMDDRTITTISTDADVVFTVAQIRTGVINRDSLTANRNDSMPTAANLVAGVPNAEVGTSFFFVLNNNDDASTLTMTTAAAGITYDGNIAALAAGAARLYLVVITNITGASEAATVFGL